MDVMHDRVAGLDVHKDTVIAGVRTMSPRRCGNAEPLRPRRTVFGPAGGVEREPVQPGGDGGCRGLLAAGLLRH